MATAKQPAKVARWTLDRQGEFLAALAATCNVAKSLRAVGMKDTGVYKLRMRSPAFREAWAVALREGYVRLEMLMLERAINGTKKAVWHNGEKVGEDIHHDPRIALQLLRQHAGAAAPKPVEETEGVEAIRARLAAKFEEMAARMGVGD